MAENASSVIESRRETVIQDSCRRGEGAVCDGFGARAAAADELAEVSGMDAGCMERVVRN
jgi:hypothetical protein